MPWLSDLDWIIQGGESGHGANVFDIDWAHTLIRDCRKYSVPYFLKQLGAMVESNGNSLAFDDGHAGDWSEWPRQLQVRQLPKLITTRASDQDGTRRFQKRQATQKKSANGSRTRRQAALKAWETRRANALASKAEED